MNPSLTILIPVHNEEEAISHTLEEIHNKLRYKNYEILIVNDHSTDNTVEVIQKFTRESGIHNLKIISNRRSGCFANALLTGLENFDTDLVVPMMGDLCDDVLTIPKMIRKIEKDIDIVCASRYMKNGQKINSPTLQGFFSWAVCFSLKILCGLPTWDASNAYKMYKKNVIQEILPELTGNTGTDFSMQLFLKTFYKRKYKICEVPTTWTGRIYGKAKFDPIKLTPKYGRWYLYALKQSSFFNSCFIW